jgi:hypothetical protein
MYNHEPSEQVIHHILNVEGYYFSSLSQDIANTKMTLGEGIIYAQGPSCLTCDGNSTDYSGLLGAYHARHRKIMNPAFSFSAMRIFLPLFQHTSQEVRPFASSSCISLLIMVAHWQIVREWDESIAQNGSTSLVLDVQSWLSRATLDALGHGRPTGFYHLTPS